MPISYRLLLTAATLALAAPSSLPAAPAAADVLVATVDSHELRMDLYLPENVENPPLVVFIHGGGWRKNSYKSVRTPWLTDFGFAIASISYRLSDKAVFPAQIHDCKGAVRWLRARAAQYGYDASRIGVAGTSAGGHLAALLGVSGGIAELEGDVAGHLDQCSRVQAVVDYFGPTDFLLRAENQPSKTEEPDSPVRLLLGSPVTENPDLARLASPAFHVSADDPPLLILHGTNDKTVSPDQSERIRDEYEALDLDVTLIMIPGAGHGSGEIFAEPLRQTVADFFHAHLAAPAPPAAAN